MVTHNFIYQNHTARWIFEKFDGVRAIWNPSTREMYSRNGNEINIPNAVRDSLPPFWLDGEVSYCVFFQLLFICLFHDSYNFFCYSFG